VYGTIPDSIYDGTISANGTVPAGTEISVYTNDGETLLYSYVTGSQGPVITSGSTMNTGYYPFAQQPIYIDTAGSGQTIFGDPH
jgi:hypothetical protein